MYLNEISAHALRSRLPPILQEDGGQGRLRTDEQTSTDIRTHSVNTKADPPGSAFQSSISCSTVPITSSFSIGDRKSKIGNGLYPQRDSRLRSEKRTSAGRRTRDLNREADPAWIGFQFEIIGPTAPTTSIFSIGNRKSEIGNGLYPQRNQTATRVLKIFSRWFLTTL
jgi:hypothetical protein